ncbi:MAG: hypothetical protein HUU60_12720 [Armatimonadetes bacterium]|nr:hypothetical protein [Armatimonadota bacterium]
MKRLGIVAVCVTLCSVSNGQLVGLWEPPQPDRDCISPAERKFYRAVRIVVPFVAARGRSDRVRRLGQGISRPLHIKMNIPDHHV